MVELASVFAILLACVPHGTESRSLLTRQDPTCLTSASGRFGLFSNPITSPNPDLSQGAQCDSDHSAIELSNGVLTNSKGQTGGIITDERIVFSDQVSTLNDTTNWSLCSNGSLAFNSSTEFWECPSGNLYIQQLNSTCSEIEILLAPCSTAANNSTLISTTSSSSSSSQTSPSSSSSSSTQLTTGTSSTTSTASTKSIPTSQDPTATALPSSGDSGISNSTKVGLGVGLGIGGALLLAVFLAWWLISRRRRTARNGPVQHPVKGYEPGIAVDDQPGVAVGETRDAGIFVR